MKSITQIHYAPFQMELPNDFPHQPPEGYRYEAVRKNASTIAIWIIHKRGFNYNDFNECRCIWGFYNGKKGTYSSPINSTKQGDPVDINDTTPYSAMKLNLNGLEQLLFSAS